MKKIIIIPYIDDDDYVYFFNIKSQINKLMGLQNSITYHVFKHRKAYKQFASNSISSFLSENEHILYYDNTKNLYSIVNNDLSEIDYIIVFQPSTIIKKDISGLITNGLYGLIGTKNNSLVKIYNKTKIIELLREKITIDEFVLINGKEEFFISPDILDAKKIIAQTETTLKQQHTPKAQEPPQELPKIPIILENKNNSECYYEDAFCIFGKFLGSNNILSSYAYFNKNNNKIYNIHNNLLGKIIDYNNDIIEVEWILDDQKLITIKYVKQSDNVFKPV